MSRGVKPIVGLIVLLAWPVVGLGGRAEAGFALGNTTPAPGRAQGEGGFELRHVLNGGEVDPTTYTASAGMAKDTPAHQPSEAPPRSNLPRELLPANLCSQGNGASTGTSSTTGAAGAGLPFILTLTIQALGDEVTGRLFLADERYRRPPFTSRLFRPPR